jgi:hypothetical protein
MPASETTRKIRVHVSLMIVLLLLSLCMCSSPHSERGTLVGETVPEPHAASEGPEACAATGEPEAMACWVEEDSSSRRRSEEEDESRETKRVAMLLYGLSLLSTAKGSN